MGKYSRLWELRGWHLGGTLAPSGTVFSKYLLESGFRNTFENKVPGGAKVPLFCNYICIIICIYKKQLIPIKSILRIEPV